ncbi:Cytochrome P450 3A9 [Fusarium oxysporum f. sp. conglutinans]|nr:Cytochrome P450 3A9 [Fusarium oxysporum f. sp. conglutinans]
MLSTLCQAVAVWLLFLVLFKLFKWRRFHNIARNSGIPDFLSPIHLTDTWWLVFYPFFLPVLEKLPQSWTTPWLSVSQTWKLWKLGHQAFDDVKCDTFILATPKGNMVWSADPQVISQLFEQTSIAKMPADLTQVYNIYGPNIGSSEGESWKKHRRVVTAGFNPSINAITWKESIHQTTTLIDRWLEEGSPIRSMREWTCRLALHVITLAFFSRRLGWNDYTDDHIPPPPGRKLSFEESIHTVISRLGLLFLTPKILLYTLPFKSYREARLAYSEWKIYMVELRDQALARLDEIQAKPTRNLLESIVAAGSAGRAKSESQTLPKETIIPNIFFTIFAGHETTGNTTAFMLLLLAIYPDVQRRLQKQLDNQLRGRTRKQWTIEEDYPALIRGYMGAVMNESMRVYNVVAWQARRTATDMPIIDSKGNNFVIPRNTLCFLGISAMLRDPNRWPEVKLSEERKRELHHSPAMNFDPSRWLEEDGLTSRQEQDNFLPFGTGPRVCPGKALALIEMTAMLAALFKDHSLELVVDEQRLEACDGDAERAWNETRDESIRMLIDDIDTNTNIRLRKDLPVRVVQR